MINIIVDNIKIAISEYEPSLRLAKKRSLKKARAIASIAKKKIALTMICVTNLSYFSANSLINPYIPKNNK